MDDFHIQLVQIMVMQDYGNAKKKLRLKGPYFNSRLQFYVLFFSKRYSYLHNSFPKISFKYKETNMEALEIWLIWNEMTLVALQFSQNSEL